MTTTPATQSFAFHGQTPAGEAVAGTLDAPTAEAAARRLAGMNLVAVTVDPAAPPPPAERKPSPLRGSDFDAFNTQLAHLATAGLPVEQGLRLIAEDMRSGRLAATVRQVAAELESGRSLPEAFDRHAGQFPPLYGRLVAAGVAANDLSGVLLNLGRHLTMVNRLRSAFWRAMAYPLVIAASLLGITLFLGLSVFPRFATIFREFRVDLPAITVMAIRFSTFLVTTGPAVLVSLAVAAIVAGIVWRSLDGRDRRRVVEAVLLPIPLIGAAVRRNLLARWCDAVRLGVAAGLDLPASFALADDAVASPALSRDGGILADAVRAGRAVDDPAVTAELRVIPPTVPAVLSLATTSGDLPGGLGTLSSLFQQQAELRVAMIPAVLTPVMVIVAAVMIGLVVIAMFAPIISLISAVSGPIRK